MDWVVLDEGYAPAQVLHLISILDGMLSVDNPISAKEQLNIGYSQYGGWHPMQGFHLVMPGMRLLYPGDPPMSPIVMTALRDEVIVVYPHDWVMVLQKDTSIEVCRMD